MTDLLVGLVLTALAYAGLMWAVVHGKRVVERVKRGEYPHRPRPKNGAADGGGEGPAGTSSAGRSDHQPREGPSAEAGDSGGDHGR